MILFRAVYKRDKMNRCITYPALDDSMAKRFAEHWLERCKPHWKDAELLQVVPWRVGIEARREDLEARQKVLGLESR
jgi:hypothetical protein